jgi:hypothetical protein
MDMHRNNTPATAAQRSRKDAQIAQPWRRGSTQPPPKNTTSNARKFNTPPAGKKAEMSISWHQNDPQLSGKEPATPSKSPNGVEIYYLDGENRIFLGVAEDKALLARFCTTGGDQLKAAIESSENELVLEPLDHAAGLIILRWINKNNTYNPRPLAFGVPEQFSFELFIKIHHATHVFHVRRELRGKKVRQLLVGHINGLRETCFEDFKLAEERLQFDQPLVYMMRSQVLSMHLVSGLAEGEYDKIVQYCATKEEGLLKEMDSIETEIREGLWGKQDGQETAFVVNKSVDNETFVASLSKKPIVQRKKVTLGLRKMGEKKLEEAKTEDTSTLQAVEVKEGKVSYADALKF